MRFITVNKRKGTLVQRNMTSVLLHKSGPLFYIDNQKTVVALPVYDISVIAEVMPGANRVKVHFFRLCAVGMEIKIRGFQNTGLVIYFHDNTTFLLK